MRASEAPRRAVDVVPADGAAMRVAPRLSKGAAEDLLDWLEAHGVARREVTADEAGTFTVRWVEP